MNANTLRIALGLGALVLAACATAPVSTQAASAAAPDAASRAQAPAAPAVPVPEDLKTAAQALDAELHKTLAKGAARRDGYTYGQDVAMLMLYAARRGDAALYDRLFLAAQPLILQNADDPYTTGFVLVRTRDGAKPVSSGSAEALWMAHALWAGASAFGRETDRTLALTILDGYARHAYVLQGVWLARHGFDFGARAYPGMSALPDYQPDFLAEAERSNRRAEWRGLAERSYELLGRAGTPSRLLLPVIQPEVGATWPGAGLDLYAPNGVTSLEATCLGAEGAVGGLPKIAQGLLDFTVERAAKGPLRALYNVEDGSVAGDAPLSADGHACLARLAAAQGNRAALALLDPKLTAEMRTRSKARAELVTSGPLLLAAAARGVF